MEGLSQAEKMERLLLATKLLIMLLDCSPRYHLAANVGDIIAGLVRVLRKFSSKPHAQVQSSNGICLALDPPLLCLCQIVQFDKAKELGTWKAAYDAGIVPIMCDLLTVCKAAAVSKVLDLAMSLMGATPPGKEGHWAGRLPREIARLLTARPVLAAAQAANTLSMMCTTHPQLLMECQALGLGESLKELSTNSNPETTAAAKQLLSMVIEGLAVSFSPAYCCFPICL
jgi:hypothetical protein